VSAVRVTAGRVFLVDENDRPVAEFFGRQAEKNAKATIELLSPERRDMSPVTVVLTVNASINRSASNVLEQIKSLIDDFETELNVLSIREATTSEEQTLPCFWCNQPLPPQEKP